MLVSACEAFPACVAPTLTKSLQDCPQRTEDSALAAQELTPAPKALTHSHASQTDFSKPGFNKYLRAIMLMANGVEPMEPNPDFAEDLKEAAAGATMLCARAWGAGLHGAGICGLMQLAIL